MKTITTFSFHALGLAGLMALTALCPPVHAAMPADSSSSTLKRADRRFIEKAAKSGMEEVALSRVAVERSTNAQVRAFAQMLVSDHTQANEKLADLAGSKGVVLPMKDHKADKWAKKDVKDFDKEYIEEMVSDHEDAVELFQKEAQNGEDPDTVAFARATLPTLQSHLSKVSDLKKMLK